ncbi:hypothetical protein [Oceanibaculum nanhaiense]|uniref:hypothetical protein n=1 Tax=Oceanibaculum nanhaiense TaxID=1909734 RepID=UPI00396DBD85
MTGDKPSGKTHEVIQPRNKLREMVGGGKQALGNDTLRKAETAAKKVQDKTDYTGHAQTNLTRLMVAYDRAQGEERAEALHDMFEISHDMRGEGGSFGFPLVTQIGDILCKYLTALKSPDALEPPIVKLHIDALKVVINQRLRGEGDDTAKQVVDGLAQIALKR